MTSTFRRRLWAVTVLLAILGAAGGVILWNQHRERQAIARLEPGQRRAIFENTLANFRMVCAGSVRETLERYCVDQAAFLKRFPECDADCERLLSSTAPAPSR